VEEVDGGAEVEEGEVPAGTLGASAPTSSTPNTSTINQHNLSLSAIESASTSNQLHLPIYSTRRCSRSPAMQRLIDGYENLGATGAGEAPPASKRP
jgi:hypothetical protein